MKIGENNESLDNITRGEGVGVYRIRKEKAKTEMRRSDLMVVRAKNKSDRYH